MGSAAQDIREATIEALQGHLVPVSKISIVNVLNDFNAGLVLDEIAKCLAGDGDPESAEIVEKACEVAMEKRMTLEVFKGLDVYNFEDLRIA